VQSGRFYGLLEGPRRALLARMERIATDSRHANLRVLREQDIVARRFRDWTFNLLPEQPAGTRSGRTLDTFIRTLAHRL
jgi:hypothetical protein